MSNQDKIKLLKRIDLALEDVRPHLRVDGGDVELVDVTEDMVVKIKWLGSCEQCAMSEITLKAGVAESLRGRIPEIQQVEAVNGLS